MTTTKTYYLQYKPSENRLLIDTRVHLDCDEKEQTLASSWISAKANFGYPLTSLQEYLLNQ
jgi:hypothetical protein